MTALAALRQVGCRDGGTERSTGSADLLERQRVVDARHGAQHAAPSRWPGRAYPR